MEFLNQRLVTLRLLAVIVLGFAAALLSAPGAVLAQVPYSIDGAVPDADCCVEFQDPVGSIAELGPLNSSVTKLGVINTATQPMLGFTNPNSSTDIATIWLDTRKDPSGDIWLYFAWQREANTGSSVISYEFQSAPADAACNYSGIDQVLPETAAETTLINACNPWSNRQAGDFLIVWDFGGGSTQIYLRQFNGTTFDAGVNLSASGFSVASLNADSSRGEGAINLTDAIFNRLQKCLVFDNVIPGTITGNSDSADYKDTVLADISSVLSISNCGVVNVSKVTQPAGETGTFAYTLQRLGGEAIDYSARTSATGTLIDDGDSARLLVLPGTNYQLTEELAGEPTYELQSIRCDKPSPGTDGTVGFSVAASESTDCVITNERLTGTITVIKEVVNGFGGKAVPADFCLALNDDENTPAFRGDDTGTQFTFVVGNQYSVSEPACGTPDTSPPGYSATLSGDCSGVITARTDKVCTITNTQQEQPKAAFKLFKDVVNDNGGLASSSAWTLQAVLRAGSPGTCTVGGVTGTDSGSGVGGLLSVSDNIATCVYELSETGGPASGYSPVGWRCDGDTALNGNEVTIGAGGGSCTITNDDLPPSLVLVKLITNDNGGTAQAGEWTLSATGPTPIAGPGGVSSDGRFSAGTYILSEFGPANYAASGWTCTGGSQNGNAITLGLGESATCTIRNDDIQPELTVVKTVVNDNGGVLNVGDFPLFINGVPVVSGAANARNTGTYRVSETNRPGYDAGTWGGDCAADGTIQLAIGDRKTCTITNDDLPPRLKIVKSAVSPFTKPGDQMVYSITISNIGGGDALGVTLSDVLPPAANPVENLAPLPWLTNTPGCTVTGGGATLTCDVGTLVKDPTPDQVESGDEASFTVDLRVTIPADYLESSPDQPGGPGTLGSRFQIDGNLVKDGNGPALDWGSPGLALINVLDPPLGSLLPDYARDNAFTDGAKEEDTVPTVLDASVPPNKSDLTNFLIAQDDVDGNGFLALGWIRTDSLGTSNFDFELNQSRRLTSNRVTPVRTNGDVLVSFDFESSGNVVLLTLREWNGTRQRWGQPRSLNIEGTGFAAINDPLRFGTRPNGETNPFTGQLLVDQSFGEAVINLTQTFEGNCRKFLSAYVKGRSSTPFTAALKDFIAPVHVEIDTCRTIEVLNQATTDATNPGQDPVSDSAIVTVSNDPELTGDADNDGIVNFLDADDDNDGVADAQDAFPRDPSESTDSDGDGVGDNGDAFPNDPAESVDTDGDGVGDKGDAFPTDPTETADSDSDGVGDNRDAFPGDPTESVDSDGDGIGNRADLDDDNDGLSDPAEAAAGTNPLNPDTDGDGVLDGSDAFPKDPTESADSDGDGVGNNKDAFPNDPAETVDTDGDGVGNNGDAFPNDPAETADSDGDGVGDNGDAFPNDPAESADSDGDGVGNNQDALPNNPNETVDSDGDGIGNNADPDDDNDGMSDAAEATAGTNPLNPDTDGDGVRDGSDAFPLNPAESADSDGDGVGNTQDAFPNNPAESVDTDGDGVGNNGDAFPNNPAETADSDGDGVGNNQDALPNDPAETVDSDGDGVGDNGDAFPNDPTESADSDGDGVGNNQDALPNNPNETVDSDGDGTGNNADPDDDNDGMSDAAEATAGTNPLNPDTDGDGVRDGSDAFPRNPAESADSDGDGVGNTQDAFPNNPAESVDTDGDGVGNNADAFPNDPTESTDTDGDGVGDNRDAFPSDPSQSTDSDGDGVHDSADAFPNDPTETTDSDGDGVGNNADAFPGNPAESVDTDGDGVGNNGDAFPADPTESVDADGDGTGNNGDAFPTDPAEVADTDGDGVGDNADAFPSDPGESADTDGDGVGNNGDAFPSNPAESVDTDGDGVGDNSDAFPSDPAESLDTDGDGTGNGDDAFPTDPAETTDSDGDGVGDNSDAFPTDPTESADTDGDGSGNNGDAFPGDPTETVDTDGDGLGNNKGLDDDGDGVPDGTDAFPTDPTETVDTDGDGLGDNSDSFPSDPAETVDTDGDGLGNQADPDDDNDNVADGDDAFPTDPTETTDTDGDGVGDSSDGAPTNPDEVTVSAGGGGSMDFLVLLILLAGLIRRQQGRPGRGVC